jgi:hypothetical protein
MSNYEFHSIIRGLEGRDRLRMLFRYAAAPVACGCRPAALLTVCICCFEAWMESRDELLDEAGLCCETLLVGDGTFILFPYRLSALARALTNPKAAALLRGLGYFLPEELPDEGVSAEADTLKARLTRTHLLPTLAGRYAEYRAGTGAEFPHEIGLFLGYPPEDVRAFIENDGKNYACRTHWKVYHEPDAARAICARIDRVKSDEADKLISLYFGRKA